MQDPHTLSEFSPSIVKALGYYVYRLIDPRNGETFYVGKGIGNRVFAHVNGSLAMDESDGEDEISEKLTRIREIRNSGLAVIHIIHRHGMDESTAFEVEAALIDVLPGLANDQGGHASNERGPMHPFQIQQKFEAPEFDVMGNELIVSVNRLGTARTPYDAARFAWRLDRKKAERAKVVLATEHGIVIGVFVADQWLPAVPENFPGFNSMPTRWGFVGHEAPQEVVQHYLRKKLPQVYKRERGAANPIRYTY